MTDNKSDGLLSGMIIGAALGAIAGVLATPRTGKDTRRILKKSADALPELAEDLATSIQFQADKLSDTTLSNWDGTLGRLREAVLAGRVASRHEWEKQQATYADGTYADSIYADDINANSSAATSNNAVPTAAPNLAEDE